MSSTNKYKCCGCISRKFPMDNRPPADVEALFKEYVEAGGSNAMGPLQLCKFLGEVQGEEGVSEESAQKTMEAFLNEFAPSFFHRRPRMSFNLENFYEFLFSPKFNPPITTEVHHDMALPLSHYYIYTGHNSYLTGNQLSSPCSVEPIIQALERGVRVIELDLWPNQSKKKAIVYHGGTLTAPVDFDKCILAIKEHAFTKSEYPVVITFEDHLTPELQCKVAEIVTNILGNVLYVPESTEGCKVFPTPESLKHRILISTKPPKEYLASKSGKSAITVPTAEDVVPNSVKAEDEEGWGTEMPDFAEELKQSDDIGVDDDGSDEESKSEYKRIISIHSGKPKGQSLKDALIVQMGEFVKRVSLSEPQLAKVAKSHPGHIIGFTQNNILRIYPYGLRFNSSNYNPLVAWTHGAQMVAFNMQGYGRPLWLVHGFFRANGGCGYVKKPEFLLPKSGVSEPEDMFSLNSRQQPKKILKVKVYMGKGWLEKFGKTYFDTFSPPDFYTRVGIAGVPADTIMKKTEAIEDNWTPHWDAQFEFPLTVPELALLRIEVHEYDMSDKDDFAGQTCFPVSELRPGVRAVQLYDKKGRELTNVRLLFRFDIVDT